MRRTSRFWPRTRRQQINEAEARLARHKRAVVSRSTRLSDALCAKLTEPGAFIIAGSVGYLIGEFSRPHRAGAERSPGSSRPAGTTFDDAIFWLNTVVALFNWSKAMLAASADPCRSGEQDGAHHGPPRSPGDART